MVASIRPVLKVLLLQEVTRPQRSMESYEQSSTETDVAVNLHRPLDGHLDQLGWLDWFLFSLLSL